MKIAVNVMKTLIPIALAAMCMLLIGCAGMEHPGESMSNSVPSSANDTQTSTDNKSRSDAYEQESPQSNASQNNDEGQKLVYHKLSHNFALTEDGQLFYLSLTNDGQILQEKAADNVADITPFPLRYIPAFTREHGLLDMLTTDGDGYSITYNNDPQLSGKDILKYTHTIVGLTNVKEIAGHNLLIKNDNSLWRIEAPPEVSYPIDADDLLWFKLEEDVIYAHDISEVYGKHDKKSQCETQYIVCNQQSNRGFSDLSLLYFIDELHTTASESIGTNVAELHCIPYGHYFWQGRALTLHTNGKLTLKISEDARAETAEAFAAIQNDVRHASLIHRTFNTPMIVYQDTNNDIFYFDETETRFTLEQVKPYWKYVFNPSFPPAVQISLESQMEKRELAQIGGFGDVCTIDGESWEYVILTAIDPEGELFTTQAYKIPFDSKL